GSDITRFLVKK
nr:Chain B, APIM motif peptide [Homo sapiens]5MLW_D Chain D, APIM motif peptide [Homo sapiens]5MLW_F Chain F, APIM motif peptide [Homo sapiens]5YD8_U Chain U, ZRANB3 [Homo sapiens]5YD8_V Chain V, ZRANB3 [Homo sapiens]5YD8_W Chain W, ZRANB3 [Homo sapiens]